QSDVSQHVKWGQPRTLGVAPFLFRGSMIDENPTAPSEDLTNQTGASPKLFKARIDKCKVKRRQLIIDWSTSVDYRRGKPTETDTDDNRIPIPLDWSQTKSKSAALFSQVPEVIVTGEGPYAAAAPIVQ